MRFLTSKQRNPILVILWYQVLCEEKVQVADLLNWIMSRDFGGFVNTQVSCTWVFQVPKALLGAAQESVGVRCPHGICNCCCGILCWSPQKWWETLQGEEWWCRGGRTQLQPQVLKALSFDIALKWFLFKDSSEGDSSWRGTGVMWFALKV